jgi:formate dehydrogenase major subunit
MALPINNPFKPELIAGALRDWSIPRQLRGESGFSKAAQSTGSRQLRPRLEQADKVGTSVCPYCAVGCGQLIYARGNQVIHIEGDPRNPINQGTLCPKGASSRQLVQQPGRLTKVLYRRPGGTEWEPLELEQAMDMIAQRVIDAREAGWQDTDRNGWRVDRTLGFAHLGGATLDNEENYLIKKLFTAMGAIQIENQARI